MKNESPVKLVDGTWSRLAFRLDPPTVRLHVPGQVVGSYLLIKNGQPLYVGRPDTCLRRRLESHPLLGVATHVAWEAVSSPERAFLSEAFWFHELQHDHRILNRLHPARPAGSKRRCPHCSVGPLERKALLRAFRAGTSPDTPSTLTT